MERIQIIGCSGSGKSTLAKALGKKTGLPVVHIDQLFWHSGWVESTKEEIDARILARCREDQWIFDGNYTRTLPQRLERCDTVFYLDLPRWVCIVGILKRFVTSVGTVRSDMGEGCPEKIDWEFLKWVWNFNKTKRERLYKMLSEQEDKTIYIFRNRRQVKRFLQTM